MKAQRGQIALIVLIMTAVALTLGLATSKKVVTENRVNIDEEMLKEAFNTAESGIDYYLGTGKTEYSPSGSSSTAKIELNDLNRNGSLVEFEGVTTEGGRTDFWLVAHDSNGNVVLNDVSNYDGDTFDICIASGFSGSVAVDYYYQDILTGSYLVKRSGYNLGGSVSGFTNVGSVTNCGDATRRVVATLSVLSKPLLVSVMPIGSPAKITLKTENLTVFPSQGKEIVSTAVVGDASTGVRRTIRVVNKYEVPPFMYQALSSNRGSITSQ
jgi:hypothetical protein